MRKTYKYRIYPTNKQTQKLERTLNTCRILYNSSIAGRRRHYEETGEGLTRIQQQEMLVIAKKEDDWLKGVHSQVLQDVLFRVERAFAGFFRKNGKAGYPRFKGVDRYDSFTYPQQPGFQITAQGLKLSRIGTVKIKMHRPIAGSIKICTIKREIDRWYACFSVEYEPVQKPAPAKAVGIDVGIKAFAVLSTGEVIENPQHLRKTEKRLAKRQRKLSRKKRGSANRKKARRRVAKLHRKVKNQRSDFHHKVSRKIVDTYGFIAVEDLNIQGMVTNHHLSKSIHDAGWGQLLSYLTYKAAEAGIQIEKVSPYYTSVNCSVCGERVSKTLADRIHKCPYCHVVLDRDHNAAINILQKSTAGTAGSYACGDSASTLSVRIEQAGLLKQEAPSVRAG